MPDISALIMGFFGSVLSKVSNFLTAYLPKLFIFLFEVLKRVGGRFVANYVKMLAIFRIRK